MKVKRIFWNFYWTEGDRWGMAMGSFRKKIRLEINCGKKL